MSMANLRAPDTSEHLKQVKAYIELDPEPGYQHAPEAARQAFLDLKYGVRIHWGLYSLWNLQGESWPFLKMPYPQRQAYQQLYRSFNPLDFDADGWMALFQRVGLKCFAFTTKHHEGFSLFDTQARVRRRVNWTAPGGPQIEACDLAYSVAETPFRRDIVAELCAAARRRDIKIDLYFSHPDWYDADFRPYAFHPLQTERVQRFPEAYGAPGYLEALERALPQPVLAPEPNPQEITCMIQRHRTQLVELLSHYGKIDMLCLDMWLGQSVWTQLRETVRLLRRLQPEVMLRIRGIGNYGDYYTPEGFVPGAKENTDMPWMVIYPLGRSFSYDPEAQNYKGGGWIVHNLVDAVAKGGNFMVGIGPDASGRFHPQALADLEAAGDWLRVNGEAIYATRPCEPWQAGPAVRFTRSKDGAVVYALCLEWPGSTLRLGPLQAAEGARLTLLGAATPLQWRNTDQGLLVEIPEGLQPPEKRPCQFAWALRIQGGAAFKPT
jgi:alpha-L-fucosidase